jgi:hypothetical protein
MNSHFWIELKKFIWVYLGPNQRKGSWQNKKEISRLLRDDQKGPKKGTKARKLD